MQTAVSLPAIARRAGIGAPRLLRRLAEARETLRRERDVERIASTLDRLNDRQLGALGLSRDGLWDFAETRVAGADAPRRDPLDFLDETSEAHDAPELRSAA